jgi:epoxide hydrolase-like predicted phosphatase
LPNESPGSAARPASERPEPRLRAVIIDWGGVLTQPMREIVQVWIEADQIDWDTYAAVLSPWLSEAYGNAATPNAATRNADVNPVHLLERGECTVAEFEEIFAARLIRRDGGVVNPEGLLGRMLAAGDTPVTAMYDLIRALRGKGVRTGLLSNSWGCDGYPREDFAELFDAVVLSGEVGMRKPEPRIFQHAAELVGVAPAECVFVDDVQANVNAAIACGMTGVRHTDPASTKTTLTQLFADR